MSHSASGYWDVHFLTGDLMFSDLLTILAYFPLSLGESDHDAFTLG